MPRQTLKKPIETVDLSVSDDEAPATIVISDSDDETELNSPKGFGKKMMPTSNTANPYTAVMKKALDNESDDEFDDEPEIKPYGKGKKALAYYKKLQKKLEKEGFYKTVDEDSSDEDTFVDEHNLLGDALNGTAEESLANLLDLTEDSLRNKGCTFQRPPEIPGLRYGNKRPPTQRGKQPPTRKKTKQKKQRKAKALTKNGRKVAALFKKK
jgi:hypothetical protein